MEVLQMSLKSHFGRCCNNLTFNVKKLLSFKNNRLIISILVKIIFLNPTAY